VIRCLGKYRTRHDRQTITVTCAAEVTNGLALCELCQRKAAVNLEFLPVYFRNLARWRPGGTGRSVPGSREPRLTETSGDRVSRATDEAGAMLLTWAEALVDDRRELERLWARFNAADLEEVATVAWLCLGFERYLTSVSTLDWCGEFVADLTEHEERLRRLTMQAIPGWYAGACRHCDADTFVVPGLTWVTCGTCGTTTFARDHVDVVMEEARGWVAAPRALAAAVVALVDDELSIDRVHERIRQWSSRKRITALRKTDADGDEVGPKRYRFGEVLDLLLTERATRPADDVVTTAEAGATLVTIPGGGSVPESRPECA
jgi:hypothetical protein